MFVHELGCSELDVGTLTNLETCASRYTMVGNGKDVRLGVEESGLDSSELRHATAGINIRLGGIERHSAICNMLHLRRES